MKVLSIYNRKGGVGKTSICAGLAMYYSGTGKKVLCIDLDSQMNLSVFLCGFESREAIHQVFDCDISDVLKNRDFDINEAIVPAGIYIENESGEIEIEKIRENLYFIPGSINIADTEKELERNMSVFPQLLLKKQLEKINCIKPDLIIIDNPPSENLLTVISLAASTAVLQPVTPDLNAVIGLRMCKTIIANVRSIIPELKDIGCVLNGYKARESVSQYTKELLEEEENADLGFTGITLRSASKVPISMITNESIVNIEKIQKKQPQTQKIADDFIKLAKYVWKAIGK